MFSTEDGDPLCLVVGGKADGEIIYVKDVDRKNTTVKQKPCRAINTKGDAIFQLIPSKNNRVIYIGGPSNSGKSTYAANYIEKYLETYPKAKFYVFSCLSDDEAIDYLNPLRVIIDESILEEELTLEDCQEHSIILFDDVDNISNKAVQKAVNIFKGKILEMGRHRSIACVVTSHLLNPSDKTASRQILNEATTIVYFPKAGTVYQTNYLLRHYYGLSIKQINMIKELDPDSRAIAMLKTYPQICLTERKAIFLSALETK